MKGSAVVGGLLILGGGVVIYGAVTGKLGLLITALFQGIAPTPQPVAPSSITGGPSGGGAITPTQAHIGMVNTNLPVIDWILSSLKTTA